ncbi:hypothetical protein TNCV_4014411 [Trichonephila clavipes]|nr:hypothetical protein TNCV_4014411 [Trichonephila clavipes]
MSSTKLAQSLKNIEKWAERKVGRKKEKYASAQNPKCSQLASLDKNNALREIKLRLSYLQGKSTTMSVIAHQTEKEWISANKKSRQRMSQTQAEGAAEQHADRLEDAHFSSTSFVFYNIRKMFTRNSTSASNMILW